MAAGTAKVERAGCLGYVPGSSSFCTCKRYELKDKGPIYDYCACGHVEQTHTPAASTGDTVEPAAPEAEAEPAEAPPENEEQ